MAAGTADGAGGRDDLERAAAVFVQASRVPVVGAPQVARYVRAFTAHVRAGVEVAWADTNGQASALPGHDGAVFAVFAVFAVLTVNSEGIDQLLRTTDPAKITAAGTDHA